MTSADRVIKAFRDRFGEEPAWITRSPGRVNIIGEHTDYNEGFALPLAIDYQTRVALRPRGDSRVQIAALDKNEELEFDLGDLPRGLGGWQDYLTGVAWALQEEGYALGGWEGVFAGDVPLGAGLSSSAALELALARAFALASSLDWVPKRMALVCREAENRWVGVNSGIMDQMISACGKRGSALLIDCRSLETRHVPLPEQIKIVILDTATRRGLVESAYNERQAQCEAAACHFNVDALRDVSFDQLLDRAGILDLTLYRRAQHVITENQRVLEAVRALEERNPEKVGELMNASHASLRDDFEVSREEIDTMVALAQAQPGCFGARLTGAGFGGCAVALVEEGLEEGFIEEVSRNYLRKTGLEAAVYVSDAADGTDFEEISI